MIKYGMATDFLASSSAHNGLSCASYSVCKINSDYYFSMIGPRLAGETSVPEPDRSRSRKRCKRFNNDAGTTNSIKVSVAGASLAGSAVGTKLPIPDVYYPVATGGKPDIALKARSAAIDPTRTSRRRARRSMPTNLGVRLFNLKYL
jgi:hypothetical protein